MRRPGDFSQKTIEHLAASAGYRCARCFIKTSFYDPADGKRKGLGRAAHIVAASPGGPRADSDYTIEQLKSADNGVHLCANCADVVDRIPENYPITKLKTLQSNAVEKAQSPILRPTNSVPLTFDQGCRLHNFVLKVESIIHGVDLFSPNEFIFRGQWTEDRVRDAAIFANHQCIGIERINHEFNSGEYFTHQIQESVIENIRDMHKIATSQPWFLYYQIGGNLYILPVGYIPIEDRPNVAQSWKKLKALKTDTWSLLQTLDKQLHLRP